MLRSTEDRTEWQQLVRSVTNPRIEDSWSQVKRQKYFPKAHAYVCFCCLVCFQNV